MLHHMPPTSERTGRVEVVNTGLTARKERLLRVHDRTVAGARSTIREVQAKQSVSLLARKAGRKIGGKRGGSSEESRDHRGPRAKQVAAVKTPIHTRIINGLIQADRARQPRR